MYKESVLKEYLEVINGHIYRKSTGEPCVYHRSANGYYYMSLSNKMWSVHKVLWVLYNGDIPKGYVVDHIDRDRSNNLIDNLRLASTSENSWNRKEQHNKQSGLPKGVSLLSSGSYRARVNHLGKSYSKESKSLEVVIEWVREKRRELHGEFYCD